MACKNKSLLYKSHDIILIRNEFLVSKPIREGCEYHSSELQAHMFSCLLDTITRMSNGHLKLNVSKTEVLMLLPPQIHSTSVFSTSTDGEPILPFSQAKNIKSHFDSFSTSGHISIFEVSSESNHFSPFLPLIS